MQPPVGFLPCFPRGFSQPLWWFVPVMSNICWTRASKVQTCWRILFFFFPIIAFAGVPASPLLPWFFLDALDDLSPLVCSVVCQWDARAHSVCQIIEYLGLKGIHKGHQVQLSLQFLSVIFTNSAVV